MTNFVLLYSGGGDVPATEEEQAAVMEAWGAWFGRLGEAVVDGGNPFTNVKSIASDASVSDGPVGSMSSGYSVIQADSLDAAVEMAKGCPVLASGGQVSVYETMRM